MPFLRFWRDKRGYEHTYLIHTSNKKGAGARILYWYRTPPGVKVGRVPFDDDVRSALEAQYPSIVFDWPKLMDTPPPPPDVEHWRERRRLEKAARQARQAAERDDRTDAEPGDADVDEPESAEPPPPAREAASPSQPLPSVAGDAPVDGVPAVPGAADGRVRKRRRRGGRRRRRGGDGETPGGTDPAGETDDTAAPDIPADDITGAETATAESQDHTE